jgi:ABC-type sugar transport system ATPase subunit
VGASGSGKSTLLSIIAGLDTPSSGQVVLAGTDLFALDEDARAALRARKVGFVFQSFQLLGNLTALENVMLPLELMGRAMRAPRHRDAAPWAWASAWALPQGAVRRRAAARGAGAGLRGEAGGAAGRRTHRQPGLRHRRQGDGADVRAQPRGRHDAGAGDARPRHRGALRAVLFGFHAVGVRLKTAPKSVVEIYYEPTRRDMRMRQFLDRAREAGVR